MNSPVILSSAWILTAGVALAGGAMLCLMAALSASRGLEIALRTNGPARTIAGWLVLLVIWLLAAGALLGAVASLGG